LYHSIYVMIEIDRTIVSEDIKDAHFVCHLQQCKGACCVEGDLGAPLESSELPIIDDIYQEVKPYLSLAGRAVIEKDGPYILDDEGDYSTSTIDGRECVFSVYNEKGILKCGIEMAYHAGKIDFRKPISCHLYPIRVSSYDEFEAVNYHKWEICEPACSLGKELSVPLYKFLEEALIRRFGKEWYDKLVKKIEVASPQE